ncbi:unnamed protein product [Dicrocoelium dendriticum]|nr:unnamed protein product [Dicrocoelium dendriticum]
MLGLGTAEGSYFKGNDLRLSSGITVDKLGSRGVKFLYLLDCSVHKQHVAQVRYKDSGQLSFESVCTENNDNSVSDSHESSEQRQLPRKATRLPQKSQPKKQKPGFAFKLRRM